MSNRIFSWVVGLLLVAIAAPAYAAPNMFSGNITLTSGYRKNFYTPSGPDPSDYGQILNLPTTNPTPSLSVMANGGFTISPSLFAGSFTSFTSGFPGYPTFFVTNTRTAQTATFYPGFQKSTFTLYADTTGFPNLATNPRQGTIRVKPSAAGFGGYMGIREDIFYFGLWNGGLGTYDFVQDIVATPGDDPIGHQSPNILYGTRTNTTIPTIKFTSEGPGTNVPWFVGTLSLNQTDGAYATVRTVTVSDNRTTVTSSGFTGSISLVSARMIAIYNRIGSIVQNKSENWARTTRINLQFLPEPGRLALLGVGVLGLLGLYRLRRR